ncbi:MAG: VTT domain-containing protein [Patescibacteria group bacterium]
MKIINKRNLIWFIVFGLPLIATVIGYLVPNPLFPDKQQMREFLNSYGILAPIVFTAVATIPVVITPLNHAVFALAGGALFGFWNGLLLIWLSKTIGTIINFYLGRFLGKTVVSKFAQKSDFNKYDHIIKSDKALIIFFLIYLVPLLSNDNLTYLIGLSTISARKFLTIVTLAHIGTAFTYAYLGSGRSLLSPVFVLLILFMAGSGLIVNKLKQANA